MAVQGEQPLALNSQTRSRESRILFPSPFWIREASRTAQYRVRSKFAFLIWEAASADLRTTQV